MKNGFTIIEVLIVIAIVAIIVLVPLWVVWGNPHFPTFNKWVQGTTPSAPEFYIYTAKSDGAIVGEPETATHSDGPCEGTLVTDPPDGEQIRQEWCIMPGGIRFVDNESLPRDATHIPMTDEVRSAVSEKGGES